MGISSPSLDKTRLKNAMMGIKNQMTGNGNGFNFEQQREAAGDYAESGIAVNASFNWFGASYQSEKFGGIAFSVNEHYDWFSQLNRSEEHTSELQSRPHLVCRLLLEKKKKNKKIK